MAWLSTRRLLSYESLLSLTSTSTQQPEISIDYLDDLPLQLQQHELSIDYLAGLNFDPGNSGQLVPSQHERTMEKILEYSSIT
ncbi:hypothetical protein XA68_18230 [Ophiocordyceps unilateralis]|uniref:Uncharacterized protein n=1 Tax=Ophiocordyceps unilateralis TaxID=268505 RepID=A0A2A9PRK4_OPHUN|nr:hypothetical protein XA68_18230 [Ophiocordyceps unilateralis]